MVSELDKLYNMFDQLKDNQLVINSTEPLIFTIAKSLNLLNDLSNKLKGHKNFKLHKSGLYDFYTYQMEEDLSKYIFSEKCKDLDLTISFWKYSPNGQSFLNGKYKLKK